MQARSPKPPDNSDDLAHDNEVRLLSQVISTALSQKAKGPAPRYDFIVQQLKSGSDAVLRRLFLALQRNVSDIGRDPSAFDSLTTAALGARLKPHAPSDSDKVVRPEGAALAFITSFQTAVAYTSFIRALVGASVVFLQGACRALVRNLVLFATDTNGIISGSALDDTSEAWDPIGRLIRSQAAEDTDVMREAGADVQRGVHYTATTAFHHLVYRTLADIMALVPTGTGTLYNILAEHFPHKRMSLGLHVGYTRHILLVASFIPVLQDRLVATIVDRMVEIDADIVVENLQEDDDEEEIERSGSVRADGEASDNNDEPVPRAVASRKTSPEAALAQSLASKLDVMFILLLRYLHARVCGCAGSRRATPINVDVQGDLGLRASDADVANFCSLDDILQSDPGVSCVVVAYILKEVAGLLEAGDEGVMVAQRVAAQHALSNASTRDHLFTLMLGIFERSILMTHKSKFTQFLLFYTCSLDASFADRFIGRLLHAVKNPEQHAIQRITSSAYLGSFLARASYLDDTTLRSAIFYLLEFVHAFQDLWEIHDARRVQVSQLVSLQAQVPDQQLILTDGTATGVVVIPPGSNPAACLPALPPLPPVAIFYAIMQAVFYVTCFQASAFREREGGIEFLGSLGWDRLIRSQLDPLHHCLESVSREFVRVAHILRLLSPADLSCSAAYARLTGDQNHTDEVTPPRSAQLIEAEGRADVTRPGSQPSTFSQNGEACKDSAMPPTPGVWGTGTITVSTASLVPVENPETASKATGQLRVRVLGQLAGAGSATMGSTTTAGTPSLPQRTTASIGSYVVDSMGASATVVMPASGSKPAPYGELGSTAADVYNPLDSFFPFDPFLLRSSSKYVAPVYRTWAACALAADDEAFGDWTETDGYETNHTRASQLKPASVPDSAGASVDGDERSAVSSPDSVDSDEEENDDASSDDESISSSSSEDGNVNSDASPMLKPVNPMSLSQRMRMSMGLSPQQQYVPPRVVRDKRGGRLRLSHESTPEFRGHSRSRSGSLAALGMLAEGSNSGLGTGLDAIMSRGRDAQQQEDAALSALDIDVTDAPVAAGYDALNSATKNRNQKRAGAESAMSRSSAGSFSATPVGKLGSKMRGLSFDESTYYATMGAIASTEVDGEELDDETPTNRAAMRPIQSEAAASPCKQTSAPVPVIAPEMYGFTFSSLVAGGDSRPFFLQAARHPSVTSTGSGALSAEPDEQRASISRPAGSLPPRVPAKRPRGPSSPHDSTSDALSDTSSYHASPGLAPLHPKGSLPPLSLSGANPQTSSFGIAIAPFHPSASVPATLLQRSAQVGNAANVRANSLELEAAPFQAGQVTDRPLASPAKMPRRHETDSPSAARHRKGTEPTARPQLTIDTKMQSRASMDDVESGGNAAAGAAEAPPWELFHSLMMAEADKLASGNSPPTAGFGVAPSPSLAAGTDADPGVSTSVEAASGVRCAAEPKKLARKSRRQAAKKPRRDEPEDA